MQLHPQTSNQEASLLLGRRQFFDTVRIQTTRELTTPELERLAIWCEDLPEHRACNPPYGSQMKIGKQRIHYSWTTWLQAPLSEIVELLEEILPFPSCTVSSVHVASDVVFATRNEAARAVEATAKFLIFSRSGRTEQPCSQKSDGYYISPLAKNRTAAIYSKVDRGEHIMRVEYRLKNPEAIRKAANIDFKGPIPVERIFSVGAGGMFSYQLKLQKLDPDPKSHRRLYLTHLRNLSSDRVVPTTRKAARFVQILERLAMYKHGLNTPTVASTWQAVQSIAGEDTWKFFMDVPPEEIPPYLF